MDVNFVLGGQNFVWDTEKDVANRFKHGVSFAKAAEVFLSTLTVYEDASIVEELREAAVGFSLDFALLYVVFVTREEDTIRIVSARPATSRERIAYENNY